MPLIQRCPLANMPVSEKVVSRKPIIPRASDRTIPLSLSPRSLCLSARFVNQATGTAAFNVTLPALVLIKVAKRSYFFGLPQIR